MGRKKILEQQVNVFNQMRELDIKNNILEQNDKEDIQDRIGKEILGY